MSGDTSEVRSPFVLVDSLVDDGGRTRGTSEVIAAAAMCLQMQSSCAMRIWKSGQVQEPLPSWSSFTWYPVPLLLVTTNSGKSPDTVRRFSFISSTARPQRLPAFD